MELVVLNETFESVAIIDTFDSLIWTDRYGGCGDFELDTQIDPWFIRTLLLDYYLVQKDSPHTMIIEDRQIATDVDTGVKLTFTGRSLESILERRIVWEQTILTGNFQNGIKKLIDESIINPAITDRKIPNFIFHASTDTRITSLTIDAQYTGNNLLDAIKQLCESKNIGFQITLSDTFQFVFSLYVGEDRSYDQDIHPYVIFSPKYDNILNSNYLESKKAFKTVALVAGEGEGANRKTATSSDAAGAKAGLARREMFVDARDISSTAQNNTTLTPAAYTAQLVQRGTEKLSDAAFKSAFEGEVDATRMFKYGTDFFIGDILQIENEFGMLAKSRVIEIVYSQSTSDVGIFPTFSSL